jgi:MFS family permease
VRPGDRFVFLVLAAGFTLAYAIMTIIAVHLLTLLQALGVTLAAAVGLGALLGPSQVGGRVLEMTLGRNTHPIWSMVASTILVAIGLAILAVAPVTAAVAIVLYGSGSGIRSIVRGTVPLALFGPEGYAILMGRLGLPTLLATAVSPSIGAFLLDRFGTQATLAILCGAAVVNIALALLLVPFARRRAHSAFRRNA